MPDDTPEEILAAQRALKAQRASVPQPSRPVRSTSPLEALVEKMRSPEWIAQMAAREEELRAEKERERQRSEQLAAEERERRRVQRIQHSEAPLSPADRAMLVERRLVKSPALELVREWMRVSFDEPDRARRVLVLLGPPGTGKTIAAVEIMSRCRSARYTKIRDLVRVHRADWGAEREEYEDLIGAGLLVIDELGTERDIPAASMALQDVIDERQRGGMTLIIGNLRREAFLGGWDASTGTGGRYDPRTYDRLRQVGAIRVVGGQSMRRGAL